MVNSSRSELKELTQKITNVQKSLEALECKVLQIDKKVSFSEKISNRKILRGRQCVSGSRCVTGGHK